MFSLTDEQEEKVKEWEDTHECTLGGILFSRGIKK